jgi:hypothetical protein
MTLGLFVHVQSNYYTVNSPFFEINIITLNMRTLAHNWNTRRCAEKLEKHRAEFRRFIFISLVVFRSQDNILRQNIRTRH